MKEIKFLIPILAISVCFQGFGQLAIKDGAAMVLTNDVKLVSTTSITNEGILNAASGELKLSGHLVDLLSFITTDEVAIGTLTIGDYGSFVYGYGQWTVDNLAISANDNFILSDNSALTVKTSISNIGNLQVKSGGSLIIFPAVSSPSSVTIERNTTFDTNTGKYSVVGSPVADASFNIFNASSDGWIFDYDETIPHSDGGTDRFTAPTGILMTAGKGYFSAFTGDLSFSGTPNYKNVNVAVTRTDHAINPAEIEGFNLLANPYTSPISLSTFLSQNSAILEEQTIWIWDDVASDAGGGDGSLDYMAINTTGSSADSRGEGLAAWDGTINVAQGFFVKANAGGNVLFNHQMKTHDGNDDESFFRTVEAEIERYWLGIENAAGSGSTTLLGFTAEASNELDPQYDATRFGQSMAVFSVLDDRKLAIQGLSDRWLNNNDSEPIRIGYQALEAGELTIALSSVENASLDALYLNDHENGTYVNVLTEAYSFQTQAGSFSDRFSLSLAPLSVEAVLSMDLFNQDIQVFAYRNEIHLRASMHGESSVINLEGRRLHHGSFESGETIFEVAKAGIYIVSLQTKEGVSTYKVKVGM